MSNSGFRKVIILAVISLLGVVAYQVNWLRTAHRLQSERFNDMVFIALNNVAEHIYRVNPQSGKIINPVKLVDNNRYVVQVNDDLHPFLLENLLRQEFTRLDLTTTFEYAIYDCFTDATVFGKTISLGTSNTGESKYLENIEWTSDSHYFGVYFPGKKESPFFVEDSGILLIPVAIILLFFGYTLLVLFKEKRFSEMRMDFVNHLSHELKTPVTTIRLISKSMRKQPENVKNYTEILDKESFRLKNLINKSLENARLEQKDIKLNIQPIQLKVFLTTISESFMQYNQSVDIHIQCGEKVHVKADSHHLENIFIHLFENSMKYSEQKHTTIHIDVSIHQGVIQISLSDNGPGVPLSYKKKIFRKFFRIKKSRDNREVTGHGLGLYYTKKYLEKFDAKIFVEPFKDSTAFFIQFPSL